MTAPHIAAEPPTHRSTGNRPLGIAILGTGVIANRHLAAIAAHPGARLVGVCDINMNAAQKAADAHGCAAHQDPQALWIDPAVDALYLCVPNFLHFPMAAEAMRHGKHVFIEKPMANTAAQCAELEAIARQTGMGVVVGHQYRFLETTRRLKQWIADGELGDVMVVNDRITADYRIDSRPEWFKSREGAGGGVLLNNGVHQIDRLCWLLDEAPAAISARVRAAYTGRDIDSHVSAQWAMPSGIDVNLLITGYPCAPDNSIEVLGTRGQARLNFVTSTLTLYRGMEAEASHTLPDSTHAAGRMIDQMSGWVHEGTPPELGVAWGGFVVTTALAHYESGRLGRPVVAPALPSPPATSQKPCHCPQ